MTRDEFDPANDDISLRAADRVTMYGETAEVRFAARMSMNFLQKLKYKWPIWLYKAYAVYQNCKCQNAQDSFYRFKCFSHLQHFGKLYVFSISANILNI